MERTFFQSVDAGESWVKSDLEPFYGGRWGPRTYMTEHAVFAYMGTTKSYWWPNVGAFYRSTDRGLTWESMSESYPMRDVHFLSPNKGFILSHDGAFHSFSGSFKTTENGGLDWKSSWNPLGIADCIHFFNDTMGFLSSSISEVIVRSRDGGESWGEIEKGFLEPIPSPGDPADWLAWYTENKIFISSSEDGFQNWDDTFNWQRWETEAPFSFAMVDSSSGVAAGNAGTIIRFSPEGVKHIPSGTILPLNKVLFMDELNGLITGGFGDEEEFLPVILRTTDGGMSWSEGPIPQYLIHDLHFSDSLNGFAVGQNKYGHGVLLETLNRGNTWTEISFREEPFDAIRALHFCDGWGWAVGDNSLILRYTPVETGINSVSYTYGNPALRVYPNPFREHTTITFNLDRSSQVQLCIYDLSGRRLATLLDQEMPPGHNEIEWIAKGLIQGLYFCRLMTPLGGSTVKMIVIR
jgi:photosystem II stability/assembly factor-like uncharacterized protein